MTGSPSSCRTLRRSSSPTSASSRRAESSPDNPTYPAEKLREQINDCNAEFVVTLTLFYNTIKQVQSRTQVKTVIVTNVKEYLPPLARALFTLAREKKDGHFLEAPQSGDYWLQDLLAKYAGRAQCAGLRQRPGDLPVYRRHDRHPQSGDVHS
ncbi:MAG: hypothetical protein U0521_22040 [Anaerolineae bacterium]